MIKFDIFVIRRRKRKIREKEGAHPHPPAVDPA